MKTLKITTIGWLFAFALDAQADCVGLITAGGGYDFWEEVERGAEAAAAELGLTVFTRGTGDEINVQGQAALIDRVSNLGCRGLVLAPNSVTHLESIATLKAEGIPTVSNGLSEHSNCLSGDERGGCGALAIPAGHLPGAV